MVSGQARPPLRPPPGGPSSVPEPSLTEARQLRLRVSTRSSRFGPLVGSCTHCFRPRSPQLSRKRQARPERLVITGCACPARVFAKCLLNFGLRPDRPAGYVTASQWETGSSGQRRLTSHDGGAHRSLLVGHQGADTVRFFGYQKFCDFYIIISLRGILTQME